MIAITLSEKLAALDFEEKALLLSALRKAMDHCNSEHARLQELTGGYCTDQYWMESGRAIYRLYKKLDGFAGYPEFEEAK